MIDTECWRGGWDYSMEIYPVEWQRLSGRLWYGPPHFWRIADRTDTLAVLPANTSYGLIGFFNFVAVTVVVGVWWALRALPNVPDAGWGMAGGVGVAVALFACSAFTYLRFVREQSRGPVLIVSLNSKVLTLTREARSWTFDHVVRLEIVHGTSMRIGRRLSRPFDQISELQLVVANDCGEWSAWPIIGAMGKGDPTLHSAAARIAETVRVPLLVMADEKE